MDDPHQQVENGYLPLYQTSRDGIIESVHFGAIAVTDPSGKLIAWYGNPRTKSFMRSSAKPLQAISLIEQGGEDRFQMTGEEIAVICASHSSTDRHLKTIYGLQKKIGVSESDLLCCTHPPFSPAARAKLLDQGLDPDQNHHNCSGKHTGMLGLATLLGYPFEGYTEPEHPVQQRIISVVSDMCGLEVNDIELGRDGCSVPAFSMPLQNAAQGWANLMAPDNLIESRRSACQVLTRAMKDHPYLIAGPGRFDTILMEVSQGTLVSKAGAEAFQAVGVFPDVNQSGTSGLGIVLKIADGDQGKRARRPVMIEVLRQLNILSSDQLSSMSDLGPVQEYRNQCQIVVGEGRPCFQLQFN